MSSTARQQRKPSATASGATAAVAPKIPSLYLSFLSLPQEALVLCTTYVAMGDPDTHHATVEAARRLLFNSRDAQSVQNSLLSYVEAAQSRLHVFALGSHRSDTPAARALRQLKLQDLRGALLEASVDLSLNISRRIGELAGRH